MRIQTFEWDAQNVEHIARHGVEPHEAEAACLGRAVIVRGRGGRHLAYGRTSDGRYLFIVLYARGAGVARIITARDMTDREQRFYQRRH